MLAARVARETAVRFATEKQAAALLEPTTSSPIEAVQVRKAVQRAMQLTMSESSPFSLQEEDEDSDSGLGQQGGMPARPTSAVTWQDELQPS